MMFKSKYIYILLHSNTQSELLLSHSLLAATKLYSAKMEMERKGLVSQTKEWLYLQRIPKSESYF